MFASISRLKCPLIYNFLKGGNVIDKIIYFIVTPNKVKEGYDIAKQWIEHKNELVRESNKLFQCERYQKVNQFSHLLSLAHVALLDFFPYIPFVVIIV